MGDENRSLNYLIEQNKNIKNKYDINPDVLKMLLSKSIQLYYDAIFKQDVSFITPEYFDNNFIKKLFSEIQKDSKYYQNSSVVFNIKQLYIADWQNETINFISDVTLKVNITIQYKRTNKLTEETVLITKEFEDTFNAKYYESGWLLSELSERNIVKQNEKEI